MATLTNTKIKDTYDGLLKTTDNEALDVSGVTLIEDGLGNASALSVGRSGNGVTVTGTITGNLSGNVTGTILTAAQPNITSVGTLSSLSVSGNLAVDTNTLYVDAANNRVIVGSNTSAFDLSVIKSSDASVVAQSTSASQSAYLSSYNSDTENAIQVRSYGGSVSGTIFGNSIGGANAFWSNGDNKFLIGTIGSTPVIFGTNNSEAMRIDSSGNVGIGNVGSNAKLEVSASSGEVFRADASGGAYRIVANQSGVNLNGNVGIGTSNAGAKIEINASGGGLGGFTSFKTKYGASSVQSLSIGQVTAGNGAWIGMAQYRAGGFWQTEGTAAGLINFEADGVIRFSTNSGLTANTDYNATERMRITSGGGILMNTQTTGDGVLRIDFNDAASSPFNNGIRITAGRTNASVAIGFSNPNGAVGSIQTSGTSTSYVTSSDYRLKENVVEMTGALDRVDALKPSRFNFIADPEKTVDGFLAHEVAEVVPEAISGEKDAVDEEGNPIYQGIDQSKIVPLLVGAIKELRAEIETLKSQLNA